VVGLVGLIALSLGLIDGFNLILIVVGAWLLLRTGRSFVKTFTA
jgi:hypothetical protein